MKPAAFTYHAPDTVDEALDLLRANGAEGKVLAGGQSLIPLLNFRLAHPDHLIDVNGIGEMTGLRKRDGVLYIGAMTRQSVLERSALVAEHWPMLAEAVSHVGHRAIRNRGTIGGSIAHADPAAELPAALRALGARFRVRSSAGERELSTDEFFITHLTTAMAPDELLVGIKVPAQPPGAGHGFVEFARRHGDFAIAGAAALVSLDAAGWCQTASLVLLAAGPTPFRATKAAQMLVGQEIDDELTTTAAHEAAMGVEPSGDIHASSQYRRHLLEVMTRRAIRIAALRAKDSIDANGSTT